MNKCDRLVSRFLLEEGIHRFSPMELFHFFTCASCRGEIKHLKKELQRLQKGAPFASTQDVEDIISKCLTPKDKNQKSYLFHWLISGTCLLLSALVIDREIAKSWFLTLPSSSYEMVTFTLLGLFISILLFAYVFTHYQDLVDVLNIKERLKRKKV